MSKKRADPEIFAVGWLPETEKWTSGCFVIYWDKYLLPVPAINGLPPKKRKMVQIEAFLLKNEILSSLVASNNDGHLIHNAWFTGLRKRSWVVKIIDQKVATLHSQTVMTVYKISIWWNSNCDFVCCRLQLLNNEPERMSGWTLY